MNRLRSRRIGRPVNEALENSEMSKRSSLRCQSVGRAAADRPLAFSQSVMVSARAVPAYDPQVHYHQVRDSWGGVRTPDGR
jgi:hypothetical protein